MPDFRAVVNLDYNTTEEGYDRNRYQRILSALDYSGWHYVETSAMAYEGGIDGVKLGLAVLAHALDYPGTPSALTVQIQAIGEPKETPGQNNPAIWGPRLLGQTPPLAGWDHSLPPPPGPD